MGYLFFAIGILLMAVLLAFSGCKKLPKFPRPVHATCYEVSIRYTTDYICPICGMRTLYPTGTDYHITDGTNEQNTDALRKLGIIKIEFDRSQFCKSCNPAIKNPKLVMIVKYEDGRNVLRTEGIDSSDYRLLALLHEPLRIAKLKAFAECEKKTIEDCYNRLSELLGIEVDALKKEAEKEMN